jgi:hypothetical protein
MYFSLSAWRRVRDSSHVCLGRKNEAAVGDLLLPMGKHQSLDLDRNVRECRPTLEVAGAIVCSVVFASRGIIPLHSQPFTFLVGDGTDIANGTCLPFQPETLAYVWSRFYHGQDSAT